jgi:hypothetical protein
MPQFTFSTEQKAQMIGWLNREKDHLLSITSMAERIILPRVSGTLDCARNDLECVNRLRSTFRDDTLEIELSDQDVETLIDIASTNQYADRVSFWKSITKTLTQ